MKKTLTLALALAPLSGFADDRSADAHQLSPTSRAERLSDAQLDQVTAGDAFTATFVFNPGNKEKLESKNNHAVCINCFGGAVPGEAFRVLIVNNPAKSFNK